MISYITNINDNIRIFCERGDICGCRALCLIESYGAYGNIIDFWVQYIDDRIVSVIVKYGADMTVVTSDDTDKNELRDFIYATGAKSIVFDRPFYNAEIVGKVMELKEPAENKIPDGCRIEKDVPLNEAYDLIKKCKGKGFVCPSYEDFILDTSHKLRHKRAVCCGLYNNKNTLCSFAMTSAMTDKTAVIGAVCTSPEYRRQGFGGAVVSSLVRMLGDRRILLARTPNENESFYDQLGFIQSVISGCSDLFCYS